MKQKENELSRQADSERFAKCSKNSATTSVKISDLGVHFNKRSCRIGGAHISEIFFPMYMSTLYP